MTNSTPTNSAVSRHCIECAIRVTEDAKKARDVAVPATAEIKRGQRCEGWKGHVCRNDARVAIAHGRFWDPQFKGAA